MNEERQPSYLWAMLSSQTNVYAALGSLALATLLSIPYGFGIGALPLIAFAAGEVIAAVHIPSLPAFRRHVDRQWRQRARDASRQSLLAEIEARGRRTAAYQQNRAAYQRMSSRIASLYHRAEDDRSRLPIADVERMEEATIEYLAMWLALLVMDERGDAVKPREIEARIAELDREIANPRPGSDLRQLQKAHDEYQAVLERHHRLLSRRRAIEAAMLSMPDRLEEIYQTIMTSPLSEDVGGRLDEAIARLRLQEDIEAELAADIAEAMPAASGALRAPGARLTAIAGGRESARTGDGP